MANTTVQLLAYVLCYTALCGLIAATCMTEWKITSYANGNAATEETRVGLWMKCSRGEGTRFICTPFSSILDQKVETNISRVVMICSLILCGLASLVTIPGLKCTRCLDGSEQAKSKVAMAGGGLFIIGGICAFGLISWYAYNVAHDFHSDGTRQIKFEFGQALFVGGAAALLAVIGGALLCVSSRTWKTLRSYPDKPAVSRSPATEYV